MKYQLIRENQFSILINNLILLCYNKFSIDYFINIIIINNNFYITQLNLKKY